MKGCNVTFPCTHDTAYSGLWTTFSHHRSLRTNEEAEERGDKRRGGEEKKEEGEERVEEEGEKEEKKEEGEEEEKKEGD